jgi:subtilase family serine protease
MIRYHGAAAPGASMRAWQALCPPHPCHNDLNLFLITPYYCYEMVSVTLNGGNKMFKRQWVVFAGLVMAIALMNASNLNAAENFKLRKSQPPSLKTPGPVKLPDLVIKTPSWSAPPKEGQTVGTASILNIVVANEGTASAKAHKLRVSCTSLTGNSCPASLSGVLAVSPLNAGQSMTYAWPPASAEKWKSGKYRLKFAADYMNRVQESSETNNTAFLTFTVLSKIGLVNKMQVAPAPKPQLNTDLQVVSIAMSPTNPVAGQAVKFVAVVKNSGKMKTPQVESLFTFWDTHGSTSGGRFYSSSPPVPSLMPEQTCNIETNTTFITLGDNAAVSFQIDRFDKLNEINETNNEKIKYFSVQCKPELALYDYTKPKPANIWVDAHPGKEVKVTVWVYNNAWCFSKAAKLSVTGNDIAPMTINVPPINPHQRVGLPITLKWETAGIRNCKLKVDTTNTNDESIENNNEMDLIVSVLGEWPGTN